jgi:hypothetical protein
MSSASSRKFTPAHAPLRGCNWPLRNLPGIKLEDCRKLSEINLDSTHDLLRCSTSLAEQTKLAQQLQLHIHHVQKWRALADLARLPSVGESYCGLLLHAGVPSVKQLALLNPGQLHRQLLRLQVVATGDRHQCPDPALVQAWIVEAKRL